MSWFTDPNCEAESLKEHATIAYAVDMDFPSGHVRLATWPGNLVILSNTYIGIGNLGSVSDIPESVELTADRWTYVLSGIDPTVVPESEIDNCFGRSVVEYEVWLNSDTHAVIGYEIRREGTMGHVRRRRGRDPVIQVDCETSLVILEQTDGWLYTAEHQAEFFTGDTGLNQVRELGSKEVIWNGGRVQAGGGTFYGGRFGGKFGS